MNEQQLEILQDIFEIPTTGQGIVVLFKPNYASKTLTEIGRTTSMPFMEALDYYSETPNPASQLLRFANREEQEKVEKELMENVQNRKWLDDLFDCI